MIPSLADDISAESFSIIFEVVCCAATGAEIAFVTFDGLNVVDIVGTSTSSIAMTGAIFGVLEGRYVGNRVGNFVVGVLVLGLLVVGVDDTG